MPKTIVLSLGGSLIVPDGIDSNFLRGFKKTIEKYTKKGYKFAIYCGGGKLARKMQKAASEISKLTNEDLDWLGIYATKLNAQLVKTMFKNNAEEFIVDNPNQEMKFEKNILIASGWLPGWSTDYDAVLLANNMGIKEIINMSNVNYIYEKDPFKHKDTKKIEKIGWGKFVKLIGNRWKAGMNAPFDPVAAKEAQKSGIKVYVIGNDLKNLENLLEGRKFKGTVIE